ncbi:MAG: hypothetical protein GKC03_05115 [Methanomassiliicoccales archaeon]|nr:hypothetical protein [Methanomassiliicoccales archaeon]NYT15411.1 hypothetical protein [Methanomassiliicoccales archaeon]
MSSLHTMTAELHTGFLVLAFIGIGGTFLLQIVCWLERPKFLLNFARKTRGYLEAAGIVAALLGVVALLLSAITGSIAWSTDMLLGSPEAMNKIVMTAAATTIWAGAVFIRLRFGRGLWTCPAMAGLYAGLSLIGIVLIGITGSMGAHITTGESLLDFLWDLLGFDPSQSMMASDQTAIIIVVISAIIIVGCSLIAIRSGLSKQSFRCETGTCSYWDEPRIRD